MSWRATVRSIEAEARRERRALTVYVKQQERAAVQRRKQLAEQLKQKQANQDAAEAEAFANYLDVLISLHKDCGQRWDWVKVQRLPRPAPPERTHDRESAARTTPQPGRSSLHESAARGALDGYSPGLFDRILGRDVAERARLTQAIETGRATDEAEYQASLAAHVQAVTAATERGRAADEEQYRVALETHGKNVSMWEWFTQLGAGIAACRPDAYEAALKHLVGFDELEELGNTVSLNTAEPDVIAIDCVVRDKEVVPEDEVSLTAKGKLSTKAMAEGKRNALYQDHVCSCALRIAREVFALLPIDRVVVNVGGGVVDTSTGHTVLRTLLAAHFTRGKLEALNFEAIDPSDSMRNFDHRMAFKKSSGMATVEPITVHDQWASGS